MSRNFVVIYIYNKPQYVELLVICGFHYTENSGCF